MISRHKRNITLLSMGLLFLRCSHILPKYPINNDILPKKRQEQKTEKEDITPRDHRGQQPIHYASRHCHLDFVKSLHEHGASLTAEDDEGVTPYDEAAKASCYTLMGQIGKEMQKQNVPSSNKSIYCGENKISPPLNKEA